MKYKEQDVISKENLKKFVDSFLNSNSKQFEAFLNPLTKEEFTSIIKQKGYLLYQIPKVKLIYSQKVLIDLAQIPETGLLINVDQLLLGNIKNLHIPYNTVTQIFSNSGPVQVSLSTINGFLMFNPIKSMNDKNSHQVDFYFSQNTAFLNDKIELLVDLCKKFQIESVSNVLEREDVQTIEYLAKIIVPNNLSRLFSLGKSGFEQFINLFMKSWNLEDFKNFVKQNDHLLEALLAKPSTKYITLQKIPGIFESNIVAEDFFMHLLVYGFQLNQQLPNSYKIPYVTDQNIGHNLDKIPHLQKKVNFILKALRGKEINLSEEAVAYLKTYSVPDTVNLYFEHFEKAAKDFRQNDFKELKIDIYEGKKEYKEKIAEIFCKSLKAASSFVELVAVYKQEVTKIDEFIKKELTDNKTKTLENVPIVDKIFKALSLDVDSKASIKFLNIDAIAKGARETAFAKANAYTEIVLKFIAYSKSEFTPKTLGSILKYKTDLYFKDKLGNFFDYLEELSSKFGSKAFAHIIKNLDQIAADTHDEKLSQLLKEYDFAELSGQVEKMEL